MNMRGDHLAFVDLEMTGLDPFTHEIIEIGIVIAAQRKDPNGNRVIEKMSEHCVALIPEHIETADPEGLKVSQYHERDWSHALPQREGLSIACDWLKDCIMIGQNVTADWTFLKISGKQYGVDFEKSVHYHRLDLCSMAFAQLYNDPVLFKYSLRELRTHFAISDIGAHTALADAQATYEITKKILESS